MARSTVKEHKDILRIHHISQTFNRIFHWPLFFAGALVVILLLVLPYWGRIVLAFIINILFNRLTVYLTYFSKLIIKPMNWIHSGVIYFLLFGLTALGWKLTRRRTLDTSTNWNSSVRNTQPNDCRFQS
ncbi:MAG: hypothetical protein IT289_06775 [Oligoflexia bacterium]|nr:hypothetical protein [Oligoflexia bacterium]